jgi:hypothetical protein
LKVATIEKVDEIHYDVHFDIEKPLVALLYFAPALIVISVVIISEIAKFKRG